MGLDLPFKIPFFGPVETILEAIKLLKKCALILVGAGIIEIILGLLFMHHILYPGLLNLVLGILLYFTQIYSLGFTIFIWSLVPLIGAFTNGWGINFQENCYALFTLGLAIIGLRIFLAVTKLDNLLHPSEPDDKLSD